MSRERHQGTISLEATETQPAAKLKLDYTYHPYEPEGFNGSSENPYIEVHDWELSERRLLSDSEWDQIMARLLAGHMPSSLAPYI